MESKAVKELKKNSNQLISDLEKCWKKLNLQQKIAELEHLKKMMGQADFWNEPEKAQKKSKEKEKLQNQTSSWFSLKGEITDFPDWINLVIEEGSEEKIEELKTQFFSLKERLERLELLESSVEAEDHLPAFINIHPGAGGTESQDWAEMLLRMYIRYFEKKKWNYSLIDEQSGEGAGIKNVTLLVAGESVFRFLKCENGIHRLVRISPFDSNKRRHTSFASVHVSPEISDEIEINIKEKDLRIDVYRSSGAGGQHVNTTDSAVRITHLPTGIVTQCQNERSQIKNKEIAMKMLRSRIYELEKQKAAEEKNKKMGEKKSISWGSQIRSYVFHPYNMVKDHRTDFETSNTQAVLNGEIEPFILAYLKTVLQ